LINGKIGKNERGLGEFFKFRGESILKVLLNCLSILENYLSFLGAYLFSPGIYFFPIRDFFYTWPRGFPNGIRPQRGFVPLKTGFWAKEALLKEGDLIFLWGGIKTGGQG